MEITANTPRHHCHPQIKKRRSCLWTWSRKCFTIWKWAVYAPIHMAWCSGKALHISAETAYLQSRPFTYWKHSVHPKMKKQTNKTKQKKTINNIPLQNFSSWPSQFPDIYWLLLEMRGCYTVILFLFSVVDKIYFYYIRNLLQSVFYTYTILTFL